MFWPFRPGIGCRRLFARESAGNPFHHGASEICRAESSFRFRNRINPRIPGYASLSYPDLRSITVKTVVLHGSTISTRDSGFRISVLPATMPPLVSRFCRYGNCLRGDSVCRIGFQPVQPVVAQATKGVLYEYFNCREFLRRATDYRSERHLWLAPQVSGQAGSLSYKVSREPVLTRKQFAYPFFLQSFHRILLLCVSPRHPVSSAS